VVHIRNLTTGADLATDAAEARTYWSRFAGLMLRANLAPGHALILHPSTSIHMMFMRFPIDAVFYDADLRVTRVATRLRPWLGLASGGRGAKGVIELPAGAAQDTLPGHQLAFEPR
jgi:uncharacterized protein